MIPKSFSLTYISAKRVSSSICGSGELQPLRWSLQGHCMWRASSYSCFIYTGLASISSLAFATTIWHVRILPVKRDRTQDVYSTYHSQQPEGPYKHSRSTKSGRDTSEDDQSAVAATIRPTGRVAQGKLCENFLLSGPLTTLPIPLTAVRKGTRWLIRPNSSASSKNEEEAPG